MKAETRAQQGDIKFDVAWTTLGEYLEHLERRGVSTNVASFVGATTVRIHELGYADRPPTEAELGRMEALVRQAMEEGALGVGSSLIYAPAFYADTPELVALTRAAGAYGGSYISHIRSEGNQLLEAVEEFLTIAREAGVPAEIYHLKAGGEANWPKMDSVIAMVERARAAGLAITADMYTYPAGATGLDAAMPPAVQEGGLEAWITRLQDPAVRRRVAAEMRTPTDAWENLYLAAGSPDRVLLVEFRQDSLKYLTGKTLAEVATLRGTTPEETAMDLVVADHSRVGTVCFLMSEDNIRKRCGCLGEPGPDAGSLAAGVFSVNPPAHDFARVLGRYVRTKACCRSSHPAHDLAAGNDLSLRQRAACSPGGRCGVRPATVRDDVRTAHQYAGVRHVFVTAHRCWRTGFGGPARSGRAQSGWTGWTMEGAQPNE
jgi:N-acyl-D-amino-acid deacylase